MPAARRRAISIVAALVLSGGCGGPYATPQATFNTLRMAAHNKDIRGMCACLTAESQEALAGVLVMSGRMLKLQSTMTPPSGAAALEEMNRQMAPVLAVMERHGVSLETNDGALAGLQMLVNPDGIRNLAKDVEDKLGFIADMYAAVQQIDGAAQFGQQFEEQIAGELNDVTIEGDQATAIVVTQSGEERLDFRKTPAGWKLHINLDAMAAGGAGEPPANHVLPDAPEIAR